MSETITIKVLCPYCGRETDAECISLITDKDVFYKEKLLQGSLSHHVCSFCNETFNFPSPLTYRDDKEKFVVISGQPAYLFLNEENIRKEYEGYEINAVHTERELIGKLCEHEQHVDTITCSLMEGMMAMDFVQANKDAHLLDMFTGYGNDGNFVVFAQYGDPKKPQFMTRNFDREYYETLKKTSADDTADFDSFMFSRATARKVLTTTPKQKAELRAKTEKIAICQDPAGGYHFAYVLPFTEKKFAVDDEVIALRGNLPFPGRILAFRDVNAYTFPENVYSLPVLGWKKDFSLPKEVTASSLDMKFKLALANYKASGLKPAAFPYEMKKSSAFIAYTMDARADDETYQKLLKGQISNPEEFKKSVNYMFSRFGNDQYLSVYLSQDDLPLGTGAVLRRCRMDDIVNLFYSMSDRMEGIVINPSSDRFFLPKEPLMAYKYDRNLINPEEFKKNYFSLTPEERRYIPLAQTEAIFKLYIEEKEPTEIMKEMNVTEEELKKLLDSAYDHLKTIMKVNY